MIPSEVECALWLVSRSALDGAPVWIALQDELARLYDAAGERRPAALGKCREADCVEYGAEPAEFWAWPCGGEA